MSRASVSTSAATDRFNWPVFVQYLGSILISLLFAPVLAAGISCVVYGINCIAGKASDTLNSIMWDFFYAEVLFSIAATCMVVAISSGYKAQNEIRKYLGWPPIVYAFFKGGCAFMAIALMMLEVVYKFGMKWEVQIQNSIVFNVAESIGFCACVITQCISHPGVYFGEE